MDRSAVAALLLTGLVVLAGCAGGPVAEGQSEPVDEAEETPVESENSNYQPPNLSTPDVPLYNSSATGVVSSFIPDGNGSETIGGYDGTEADSRRLQSHLGEVQTSAGPTFGPITVIWEPESERTARAEYSYILQNYIALVQNGNLDGSLVLMMTVDDTRGFTQVYSERMAAHSQNVSEEQFRSSFTVYNERLSAEYGFQFENHTLQSSLR